MMYTRCLLSLYTGLLVYLILIFFFGSTGKFVYREYDSYRQELKDNVEILEKAGRGLEVTVSALQTDSDMIVKEARNLMYLQENEGIIRIEGRADKPRVMSPGSLVAKKEEPSYRPEPFLRAFSVCIGIVTFLLAGIHLKKRRF